MVLVVCGSIIMTEIVYAFVVGSADCSGCVVYGPVYGVLLHRNWLLAQSVNFVM